VIGASPSSWDPALLAGVSLTHLASAYQQRLDSHSEVSAILEPSKRHGCAAQNRFDKLFFHRSDRNGLMRELGAVDCLQTVLRVVWELPSNRPSSKPSSDRGGPDANPSGPPTISFC